MTVTADQAFAAVLGDPVTHSKSPSFHESFFKKYQMSFFAIHITKPDFELALKFLTDLGLRAAAVTSPLKILANEYCFEKSLLSAQLESVNTLTYSDGHWIGANTDKDGLEATIKRLEIGSQDSVAVWGGGGVLPVIKSLVPNAEYYSSSSEKPLAAGFVGLIWAAPPDRKIPVMTAGSVKWVLDLNYREDSRAKEFAMKSGARYFSGLEMFEIQAHRQQQIWSQFFERK
jgi:shikimate 5-dehydrogenase